MSRSARFIDGVFLGYLNMALVMAVGLFLTPFFLRQLGQHDYGVWLIGLQLLAYFSLLDFGVLALLPRETAYATGEASKTGIQGVQTVVGNSIRVLFLQAPLMFCTALGFYLWMPAQWAANRGPVGILAFAFSLTFPLHLFRAVLEGLQDMKFLGQVQMASWAAGTTVSVVLVAGHYGLYSLAGGWVVTEIVSAGACFYRLRKRHPGVIPNRLPPFSGRAVREYLTRSGWISVSQVAQVLLSGTEILVIGKLLGPSVVVVYSCTGKLLSVLANQPQSLMQVALPGLSEMKTGESKERILQASTALGQAMLLLSGAVVCVVIAANGSFVSWWVGRQFYLGVGLTALMAAAMLMRHLNLVIVYTLFSLGFQKRIAVTQLTDGIVSTVASLALVPVLGPAGAPLGSMLGTVLVSLTSNARALGKAVGASPVTLMRPFLAWTLRSGAVVVLAIFASRIELPLRASFILIACAVGLLYAAFNYGTLAHEPLGIYLMPRLRSAFARLRETQA